MFFRNLAADLVNLIPDKKKSPDKTPEKVMTEQEKKDAIIHTQLITCRELLIQKHVLINSTAAKMAAINDYDLPVALEANEKRDHSFVSPEYFRSLNQAIKTATLMLKSPGAEISREYLDALYLHIDPLIHFETRSFLELHGYVAMYPNVKEKEISAQNNTAGPKPF